MSVSKGIAVVVFLTPAVVMASQQPARSGSLQVKEGDQVIALRDTNLQVSNIIVQTVRRGQRLPVEAVQGKWLWVFGGQARGWIDGGSVMEADLFAWYQRLADNESVEKRGHARAKFDGVLFEIVEAGSKPLPNFFQAPVNGIPVNGVYAYSKNVNIYVGKTPHKHRRLLLKFPGGGRPFPYLPELQSYGKVRQGDYVLILADTRQVFVNGEVRRPQ